MACSSLRRICWICFFINNYEVKIFLVRIISCKQTVCIFLRFSSGFIRSAQTFFWRHLGQSRLLSSSSDISLWLAEEYSWSEKSTRNNLPHGTHKPFSLISQRWGLPLQSYRICSPHLLLSRLSLPHHSSLPLRCRKAALFHKDQFLRGWKLWREYSWTSIVCDSLLPPRYS